MKYYAVKEGKEAGIYSSWEECKKNVHGHKGAKYKSFKTLDEAKDYLKEKRDDKIPTKKSKKEKPEKSIQREEDIAEIKNLDQNSAIAYIDGSHSEDLGRYSAGGIVFLKDGEYRFKKAFEDDYLSHRNVAGELMAAKMAIDFAVVMKVLNLKIIYDYEGIRAWAVNEWKTNNDLTKNYAKYFASVKDKINITFKKVKSHSCDKYNDLADKLAKEALSEE